MTMSDSGKVERFPTKIASNDRRRRLEIRRTKSVRPMKNCQEGMNPHLIGDGYMNGIRVRGVTKEVTSRDSTKTSGEKESGTDDGKLTSSELLSSSENEGLPPLEILVTGGEDDGEESRDLTSSHGSISVIGRRRAMEDAVTVALGVLASYDFFAVYDGHGGCTVAQACRDRLHQLLAMEMEGRVGGGEVGGGGGGIDWVKVMVACFLKMDDEVNGGGVAAEDGSVSVKTMGSTAVVVMVGKEEVVVANCGDSRAVLCRAGVAVPLSRDHKPDRPDERERVEAAGGRVINWNGCRVLGVLATSRSIGDHYLKPYVISEPEVTVNERTNSDDFIIIASDGLWDVVSNQVACEVVRKNLDGQMKRRFSEGLNGSNTAEAAAMLAELAMARGSKDNISVIVVELKRSTYSIY